jgi:hypothetical protein
MTASTPYRVAVLHYAQSPCEEERMTPLFTKLNHKGQSPIAVLNAPASFETELAALEGVEVLRDTAGEVPLPFVLAFVTRLDEVERYAALAARTAGDALVWFAYPKGSSKNYRCEFNRDTGWAALGAAGFEGVRQVAIDADWSALRFRRVEFIKTMTRDPKRRITKVAQEDRGR